MQKDTQKQLEEFFLKGKKLIFKKGAIILRSDELPSGVYFLVSGFIKDSALSQDGQEFTLFIFKAHDVFPYNWAFNKIPIDHSFTAMTDCVVLRQDREEFLRFIAAHSEVMGMLMGNILLRMRGVMQRLEYMAFGNARQKIASIMTILGERFGIKTSEGLKITLPVSHKDVAELVGLTRETASIEIKKLEGARVVKRTSKFYLITNKRLLLKAAQLRSPDWETQP